LVPERSRAVIVDDGFCSIIGHPQEELENRADPQEIGLTPRIHDEDYRQELSRATKRGQGRASRTAAGIAKKRRF
jgi:hypothetical protein